MSCVDELLVSITAVRRIYRLAVRAPGRRLLVFIFSGASDRGRSRMQGVRSSCCSGVHCSARNAYIRAASAPRRRVCAAKTRPEVPPKTTPCRPATARPALPINETRGCAGFGPKGLPLAQGPRPAARAPQGARHPPRRRIGRSPRYPSTPASAPPRLREAAPSAAHPLFRGRRRAKAPRRAAMTRLNVQRT